MTALPLPNIHVACRNSLYPGGGPMRAAVPRELIAWAAPFEHYAPVPYTARLPLVSALLVDDPADGPAPTWNAPGRASVHGTYDVVPNSPGYATLPRNPAGRTGVSGRGCLPRFGPNYAADPVVTRTASRDADGNPVIEVLLHLDATNALVLPGGCVIDYSYHVNAAKPFAEPIAALPAMDLNTYHACADIIVDLKIINNLLYVGAIDDPRNTDNAWIETAVVHHHLPFLASTRRHHPGTWRPVTLDNIPVTHLFQRAMIHFAVSRAIRASA